MRSSGIAENGSALSARNGPAPEGTEVVYIANHGKITESVTLDRDDMFLASTPQLRRRKHSIDRQLIRVLVDGRRVGVVRPVGAHYRLYRVAFRVAKGPHTITLLGTNTPGRTSCSSTTSTRGSNTPKPLDEVPGPIEIEFKLNSRTGGRPPSSLAGDSYVRGVNRTYTGRSV